jgi:NAD(P)-dependent dehydrogenase (short-subunit alcohol dehydrogenase family)
VHSPTVSVASYLSAQGGVNFESASELFNAIDRRRHHGGTSRIGLATAEAPAAVGRPVALWDINCDAIEDNAKRLKADFGIAAAGVGIDLRDPAMIDGALAFTRDAIGTIGGLVHAAGTVQASGFEGVTPQSWDDGLNVHLRPLILIVQAMLPDLRSHPGSSVVAIASMNASLGNGMIPIYTAAKGGIISLVRSMADALAQDGIRINTVSPDMIDTLPCSLVGAGTENPARSHRTSGGGCACRPFSVVRRGELRDGSGNNRRRWQCIVAAILTSSRLRSDRFIRPMCVPVWSLAKHPVLGTALWLRQFCDGRVVALELQRLSAAGTASL